MSSEMYFWIGFHALVFVMLALDLGIFNRKSHTVGMKEALGWSAVWIVISQLFNIFIYRSYGSEAAVEFLTGYILELSLSVDNLFVFLLLFSYFKVPSEYQHKVLFWGILGAQLMRAFFIAIGTALIAQFHWILYIFGAFLVYTGLRMAFDKGEEVDPESNLVLKLFRKVFPISPEYHGSNFFVNIDGKKHATILFVVLLIVEATDLVFAVDSIPAVFAVTRNPLIVYTSNIFAILGLRSMYFALAGIMNLFHYLKIGLAFILSFIGIKMLIADFYHMPTAIALGVVAGVLTISVVASMMWPETNKQEVDS
jgi:tellurite resistance protein TerC